MGREDEGRGGEKGEKGEEQGALEFSPPSENTVYAAGGDKISMLCI